MKKGILKALGITALIAVSAVGGLALGAEISNGFETTYSESAYEDYGEKQHQAGYKAGKEEGLQEGFENGHQDGHDEGYKEGQQAGYDSGFEAGQIYRDPEKTYLEDVFAGYAVNIVKTENYTFLSSTTLSLPGLYLLNADGSTTQIYDSGCSWSYFNKLSNGNFLISSSNTAAPGILLYNNNTNEVTKIYSSGSKWDTFLPDENGVTISSIVNADQGKVYYDFTTGSVTPVTEESSYENLTMPYSEFKAKMVDDDFYIFNSEDRTQFNQIVTTYNLLDSIAFRKTASEENGNKKSTYEIYCFYGTEEEAKAVNVWIYDYDESVADSLFGAAENSEFTEANAKNMLEGIFTMFLNGQDINIEAYDGSSLLLFDVSEIEEALSVNL